ncbi:MAG: hypothetical protein K6U11_00530 [bacterium]|nr:hypothetical protein [bacterium]
MKDAACEIKIKAALLKIFLAGLWCSFWVFSPGQKAAIAAHSPPSEFAERLNQEISSLFRPPSQEVQRSFSPLAPLPIRRKCATPLIRQALRHPELLTPENRFILHRPTDLGDPMERYEYNGDYYYGRDVSIWSYDTDHFRLYYTEDNRYGDAVEGSDGKQMTIPAFVVDFAQYFEESWNYLTETLSYQPPSQKTEVFILNIAAYGITSADDRGAYILVSNDYQWDRENLDSEGKKAGAMKVTAVHEFFHVVQAGYDQWPTSPVDNMWWEENTAVWIEDELYDEVDDYLNYLGWPFGDSNDNGRWNSGEPYFNILNLALSDGRQRWGTALYYRRDYGWFDYPYICLTKTSRDLFFDYEYGGVIWAKFLSETFGSKIILTIFEQIQPPSYDILAAIDRAIGEFSGGRTSFDQAFILFKLTNLQQNYEEGISYPIPWHKYDLSIESESSITDNLDCLSCQYLICRKPASGSAIRLRIDGSIQANLAVLATPASSYSSLPQSRPGFGTAQLINLDGNQHGTYDFSFSEGSDYSKLIIIPINLSQYNEAWYTIQAEELPSGNLPPAPLIAEGSPTTGTKDGYLVIRLGWEPVREGGRYQIWRGRKGKYQSLIFQSPEIAYPSSTYQDSNVYEDIDPTLDGEETYLYQVKFVTDSGTSSSEIAQVTTPKLPISQVQVRYKRSPAPCVEISFQVDPNIITYYQIERKIKGISSAFDTVLSKTSLSKTSGEYSDQTIITHSDYQIKLNTAYLYLITAYNAQDNYFRREISIRTPAEVPMMAHPPSSSQNDRSGCFIASLERFSLAGDFPVVVESVL